MNKKDKLFFLLLGLLFLFFLSAFYYGVKSAIKERTMNNVDVRRIDARDYIISFTNGYGELQTYRGDKFEWFNMKTGQRDTAGYFSHEFEGIQRTSEWEYKDKRALAEIEDLLDE